MYRVNLSNEQRQELNRRAHQPHVTPKVRDRLEMLRLSDAGWSVPKIAAHLAQHEQTVRRWIKAFLDGGLPALADKPRGGKTSVLTPTIMQAVVAQVRGSQQTWSAAQIADWIAQEHQVQVSVGRVRVHLRRANLTYKRTRRTLTHKQKNAEVAAKQGDLETLKKGALLDCST